MPIKNKNSSNMDVVVRHSRGQKVAGALALMALFVCGVCVGVTMHWGDGRDVKHIGMSESQCEKIVNQMNNIMGSFSSDPDTQAAYNSKLRELNDVYTKNCAGRTIVIEHKSEPKPVVVGQAKELSTCEKIEQLLLSQLHGDGALDVWAHQENARVYDELILRGCDTNKENFARLKQSELEIAESLKKFDSDYMEYGNSESLNQRPCEVIEKELTRQLMCDGRGHCEYDAYLGDAKIYSTMAVKGCAENSQKYKDLALGQLEIASALARGNDMMREENAEIVIDTYKKLQMQNQARDFLDKMQKLSEPAIDFILTMEKIINE